jgi:exodeoxyribonuclease V gamma subunit
MGKITPFPKNRGESMKGLHFFRGNDQLKLADTLESIILANPLPPMTEELIIVQTRGLERWFRLRFAEKNTICAGLKFLSPVAFIQLLERELIPGTTDETIFDSDNLTWSVYRILKENLDDSTFSKIRNYIDGNERKAYRLSEKIADLFDQYLAYRPELIEAWTRGQALSTNEDEIWQKELWTRLITEFSDEHSLKKYTKLRDSIPRQNIIPFERVSLFLVSTSLPAHLDILEKLSEKTEVNLFFFDPGAEGYWLDDLSPRNRERLLEKSLSHGQDEDVFHTGDGNELLQSWGMMGKEFLRSISDLALQEHPGLLRNKKPTSLLHLIQTDLFHNFNRKHDPETDPFPLDDSLHIASAHSKVREIEILHDYLLSCFDKEGIPDLRPDDVLVMVPDINEYAAFINGIFENRIGPLKIPHSIADAKANHTSSCATQFISLLKTITGRFEASSVLSLLEFPPIREKFKISEQDFQWVQVCIHESGIRWGLDEEHRENYTATAWEENSWRHGLDRMLMGYAISKDTLVKGISPFTAIEGSSAAVLGYLMDFVQNLQNASSRIREEFKLDYWKDLLLDFLTTFFERSPETEKELNFVERAINNLDTFHSLCHFQHTIPLDIITTWLSDYIDKDQSSVGFISGGVTFCSMIPMRAIPFRLICILGLNDANFPRKEILPGFNLMKNENRALDRDIRKSDRYLFLEALLSAGDRLYLSFIGRSIKDNTGKQPSIVISELMDFLEHAYGIKDVILEHPMASFSKSYFTSGSRLFTYSQEDAKAASIPAKISQEEIAPEAPDSLEDVPSEIRLSEIITFFKNPMKYYLTIMKGTAFPRDISQTGDEELFNLNSLEKYLIQDKILTRNLHESPQADELYQLLNAKGKLPHGNAGRMIYEQTAFQTMELLERFKEAISGHPETSVSGKISFTIGNRNITVSGDVTGIYGTNHIKGRPTSSPKAKDILELMITHLFVNALDGPRASSFLSNQAKAIRFNGVSTEKAGHELQKLLNLFLVYRKKPMPFIPSVSYEYVKAGPDALRKAESYWNDPNTHDNSNVYFNICMDYFRIFKNPAQTRHFGECAIHVFSYASKEGGS